MQDINKYSKKLARDLARFLNKTTNNIGRWFVKTFNLTSIKNYFLFFLGLGIVILSMILIWVSTLQLPDFKAFNDRKVQSSTKIYDRTGEIILYDVHQDIKRTIIPYEDMGVNIKNATVAIEDSEFYNHKGIRINAIIRSTVWAKLTGRKIAGGSTITQQLIKNTLLTQERTITRKVKEWILAIKLEKMLSKDEILALYLNEAPYGGNLYGIEEASKAFFGKGPAELTLAESAYMAAIPNAPTRYSPYGKNKKDLDTRKNIVLNRMLELQFINPDEHKKAREEVVVFLPYQPANIAAPHFVFFIKEYLENKYETEILDKGGLKVVTTIDYELQKKAEESAFKHAKENEKNWKGENASVVAIDPKTGQILAMVGSRDYFDKTIDGNFNVATALRQPGSSFKPIVYALAFKEGYTADTVLFDTKTEFNSSCSPLGRPLPNSRNADCYMPNNYDNAFRGPMTLKNALAQSINVVAVKLSYLVGIKDSIKMAHDLGVSSLNDPDRYGLSLVIGGGETTLLDMTSVYSVFANDGIRNPYQGILSVEDANGVVLEKFKENSYQVLDSNITRTLSDILSDNIARTPTFGANSILIVPGKDVAVKTGTTNSNRDAWTIGYSPNLAVGVWVGNNDNTPMGKGGAALAGPIWNEVISFGLRDRPLENFEEPDIIDPSTPPILRGFWQGGETFFENGVEQSITNVHTILYWIDKNNPFGGKPSNPGNDPLYENWEYGVQKWWEINRFNYKNNNKPIDYDLNQGEVVLPILTASGIKTTPYLKNEDVVSFIQITNGVILKKVDVFVNDTYLTSIKILPHNLTFTPAEVDNISGENTLRIIGYDQRGNSGEVTQTFLVSDI